MSDEKPPEPPGKSTPVASQNELSLAELIAKTPGAQTREQLLERIKARERKRPKKSHQSAPSEEQLSTPEPMPIHDNPYKDNPYQWAVDHFKRKQAEVRAQQKPPKRSKPRVVVDNDKPGPRIRSRMTSLPI